MSHSCPLAMNRIVVSVQAPVPTAVPIMSLEVHLFSMNPLQRFSRTRVYLTGLTSTLLVLGSYEKNSEETYRYFPSDHYERQHFWNFVCRSEERSNFEIVQLNGTSREGTTCLVTTWSEDRNVIVVQRHLSILRQQLLQSRFAATTLFALNHCTEDEYRTALLPE
jgi:hypothetical protein